MIVCSHQPSFFPWIGYWNKVAHSDRIIMSCAVKFDYGGYQNRVPFNGTWLTVPVEGEAKHKLVRDVRFHPEGLKKTVLTIRQQLGGKRWPGRDRVHAILDRTLAETGIDLPRRSERLGVHGGARRARLRCRAGVRPA